MDKDELLQNLMFIFLLICWCIFWYIGLFVKNWFG